MAGLVASSAGCAFLVPLAVLIIGAAAGLLVILCIEWLELHLRIDDPSGVISTHLVASLWGILAVSFFDHLPLSSGSHQWLAQLIGVASLAGFVFPLTYGLNLVLNRFVPYRVRMEGERQGLDLFELGANAYPEIDIEDLQ